MEINQSNPHLFPDKLIELIKEGVIVTSYNLQPIYSNRKAREICNILCDRRNFNSLPTVIIELYYKLIENLNFANQELIIDYQISESQIIRIRVNYLTPEIDGNQPVDSHLDECPWLLIFLEDRSAIWQEDMRIEQKKYGLSDRETEISGLLLQSYSYQEIAHQLQISLNTVKFHIKNINGKKRSYLASERYCFAV